MTRLYVGYFTREHDILQAAEAARLGKVGVYEAYTPFPVHGMDAALGVRPSRLPYVTFCAGALGLSLGLYFEWWTSAVSWRLNVGGKPYNSLPAFIPVAFEITILFAGLFTVAALLLRSGLLPGRRAPALMGVTNDRFALTFRAADPGFHEERVRTLCTEHGAVETSYVEV